MRVHYYIYKLCACVRESGIIVDGKWDIAYQLLTRLRMDAVKEGKKVCLSVLNGNDITDVGSLQARNVRIFC